MLNNSNIIDRIKLPFRKEKELFSSLYNITGFYPRNIGYYKLALMHKSMTRKMPKGRTLNNERLEFLGDAILDAVVGDIVYRHFEGKREGFLTNTRSKLVQRDTLNKLAQEMGIMELIRSNTRTHAHNNYMGGNAFEALVGAIYLDRGYNACMKFMQKRILARIINLDKVAYKEVNFKSKLIEWCQKNRVRLEYKQVEQNIDNSGSPMFVYQVVIEGIEGCTGKGYSKKESQQLASQDTLKRLRREPQFIDAVFAAKTERTKMEEMPVMNVPDTELANEIVITNDDDATPAASAGNSKATDADRQPEAAREQAGNTDEKRNAPKERRNTKRCNAADAAPTGKPEEKKEETDEFDLSDLTLQPKEQSREEIINAAEEEAYA